MKTSTFFLIMAIISALVELYSRITGHPTSLSVDVFGWLILAKLWEQEGN